MDRQPNEFNRNDRLPDLRKHEREGSIDFVVRQPELLVRQANRRDATLIIAV